MLSSQDEMSCGTDQPQGSADVSLNGEVDFEEKETGTADMDGEALTRDDNVDAGKNALEEAEDTRKRKFDSGDEWG